MLQTLAATSWRLSCISAPTRRPGRMSRSIWLHMLGRRSVSSSWFTKTATPTSPACMSTTLLCPTFVALPRRQVHPRPVQRPPRRRCPPPRTCPCQLEQLPGPPLTQSPALLPQRKLPPRHPLHLLLSVL